MAGIHIALGAPHPFKNQFRYHVAIPLLSQVIFKSDEEVWLILADIGSNLYITGAPDDRRNNDDLQKAGENKDQDFEVVRV